jgi:hypothetical protein
MTRPPTVASYRSSWTNPSHREGRGGYSSEPPIKKPVTPAPGYGANPSKSKARGAYKPAFDWNKPVEATGKAKGAKVRGLFDDIDDDKSRRGAGIDFTKDFDSLAFQPGARATARGDPLRAPHGTHRLRQQRC